MIEKIQLLPDEDYWPLTPEYLDGKISMMIRKINEMIDHLNQAHGDVQPTKGKRE